VISAERVSKGSTSCHVERHRKTDFGLNGAVEASRRSLRRSHLAPSTIVNQVDGTSQSSFEISYTLLSDDDDEITLGDEAESLLTDKVEPDRLLGSWSHTKMAPRSHVVLFIAFMAALIPTYREKYTSKNFLYICDVALLVTLAGYLTANEYLEKLLLSSALSGILFPQIIWTIDFVQGCFGLTQFCGISEYMFSANIALYLKAFSFFHLWLPWLLFYSLLGTGFDRNGWIVWSLIATVDLIVCYLVSPPPGGGPPELPRNINKVFGLDDEIPQTKYSPRTWLLFLIMSGPVLMYYPTAVILDEVFRLLDIGAKGA